MDLFNRDRQRISPEAVSEQLAEISEDEALRFLKEPNARRKVQTKNSHQNVCSGRVSTMAKSTKPVTRGKSMASGTLAPMAPVQLLNDLRELIDNSRQRVARALNAALVLLYWQIGQRIRVEILKQKRADYGKRIVHALSGQWGWTHLRQIIYLKEPLQRHRTQRRPQPRCTTSAAAAAPSSMNAPAASVRMAMW
ncbi:MAG: DUF1016 N-terminal domain-containing protein [Chthoniobacterales bacterium]